MATVFEVFDPAMCCSTGVCGPEVDPKLVHFAADLDWLKSQGVDVRRYNLAHQPTQFANQSVIRELLTKAGTAALPAILANGTLVSQAHYPSRVELAAMAGLTAPSEPATRDSLTAPMRELAALAAAVGANCEWCFEFHHAALRKLGVSADDMASVVHIAQQVKNRAAERLNKLAQGHHGGKQSEVPSSCCTSTPPVNIGTTARKKTSCCGN